MPTEDQPPRLNAPLVRALMWGAQIPTIESLADRVGVDKANLSRAYRGLSSPSVKMLQGLSRLFPLVPLNSLVKNEGDDGLDPTVLGLRPEHLDDPVTNGA